MVESLEDLRCDVVRINTLLLPGIDNGLDGVSDDDDGNLFEKSAQIDSNPSEETNLSGNLVQYIVEMILGEEGVCRIGRIPKKQPQ